MKDLTEALKALEEDFKTPKKELEYKAEKRIRVPAQNCICSFQGLLQAMDGITAQQGRMVFFTTNNIECLDPALIRPGRIDRQFEFKNAGLAEVESMFRRFFKDQEALVSQDAIGLAPPSDSGAGLKRKPTEAELNQACDDFCKAIKGKGERTEFSLAQVQGYLMTKVRESNPLQAAVEGAASFFDPHNKTTSSAELDHECLAEQDKSFKDNQELKKHLMDIANLL